MTGVSPLGESSDHPTAHAAPPAPAAIPVRKTLRPCSGGTRSACQVSPVRTAITGAAKPSLAIVHPSTSGCPSSIATSCSTATSGGVTIENPCVPPCSTTPSIWAAYCRCPTSHTSVELVPSIPVRMFSLPPKLGTVTSDHARPSQCSTSGSSPIHEPTAHTSDVENAFTAKNEEIPIGPGGTWTFASVHFLPSHCWMNGLLTGPTTWPPTAHARPPVASTASRIVPRGGGCAPPAATSEHAARSPAANTPDAAAAKNAADTATTTSRRRGVGRIGGDRVLERPRCPGRAQERPIPSAGCVPGCSCVLGSHSLPR